MKAVVKQQEKFGTYEIELGVTENYDNIKTISLTITYPTSKDKQEKIEMQRLKVKEN